MKSENISTSETPRAAEYGRYGQEASRGPKDHVARRERTSLTLPDDVVELTPVQPDERPAESQPSQAVTPLEKKALLFSIRV